MWSTNNVRGPPNSTMATTTPQDNDVLFGRGFAISAHPGNQTLRILVRAHKPTFLQKRKAQKRDVARQIVDDFIHKLGGRFLIEDPNNKDNSSKRNNKEGIYEKAWVGVETEKAVDKVMHRLREKDNQQVADEETQAKADKEFLEEIKSMPHKRHSSHTSFTTSEEEESSPSTSVGGDGEHEMYHPAASTSSAVVTAGGTSSDYILPQDPTLFDSFSLDGEPFDDDLDLPFDLSELNADTIDPIPLGRENNSPGDGNCIMSSNVPSQETAGTDFASASELSSKPAQTSVFPLYQPSLMNPSANIDPFKSLDNSSFYMLDSAENPMQESMPVVDFLKSGRLGNRIELPRDISDLRASQASVGPNEDIKQCGQRVMENASTLALLLTRLFVEHISQVDVTTIQMNDFIVNLDHDIAIAIDPTKDEKWVLLRLGMMSPVDVNGVCQQSNHVSFQALGKLLYSIFTLGESLPFNLVPGLAPSPQVDGEAQVHEDDDIIERLSKSFRGTDKTVFSTLLQGEILPVSICRLIADAIDIGPNGKSETPHESVESIERDLKQMVSKPSIFLHDAGVLGGSHQFGQAHYGRHEEMKVMAAIVSRMKQSIYQTNVHANLGPTSAGIEAVMVSGIAGSGKTSLLRDVREHLLDPGFLVIKVKFERGLEHLSRGVVSSLFDQVVAYLVRMRSSESQSDADFGRRASQSFLDSVGFDRLKSLSDFLPSLPSLFSGLLRSDSPPKLQGEDTNWRLIYSISKIIEAVLDSDRFIMICCDDLQWADKSALSLISEILVNIGSSKHVSSRCLFFGLYRNDEIDESHPFNIQHAYLKMMPDNITMTEIQLASFSKDDVASMLMAELRLPRRCIKDLAVSLHNKTSGHPYFVVEVLNSLLRDKIITFSPKSRRFTWDEDTISFVPTGDGVAGLIAENIKSLPVELLNILQILSCFGVQSDVQVLRLLERFQKGITNSLPVFVDKGILEQAGPVVMYCHDLIQQACYKSMTLLDRQALHLKLGECIGTLASEQHNDPLTSMSQLNLSEKEFFGGRSMTSSLISLACDQIDFANPGFITDTRQKVRFARWYLAAGKQTYRQFNAHAALHYYSKGIELIDGEMCWSIDLQLSHELHKGAIHASFALADTESVASYAQKLMDNVGFEHCLDIQPIVLQSLGLAGKHEEAINRGLELMRELKFDVPLAPTPPEVMKAVGMTDALASSFNKEQMVDMCGMEIGDNVHQVVKILDAFYTSCYTHSSPFLPIVACTIIQFSLKCGICREATVAFATFGMLKIFFAGDYSGGQYWADVVRAMEQKHKSIDRSSIKMETHALLIVNVAIDIWFKSPLEISKELDAFHNKTISTGQVHTAMIATGLLCRCKLLGGENLSLLATRYQKELKTVGKHSHFVVKYLVIDSFLLAELTGQDCFSSVLGDSFLFKSMSDIQNHAKSAKEGTLLQSSHVFNVMIEYWRGNLLAAEEHSRLASMMFPASKEPSIYNIHHTFFRGLILFRLHRTIGGSNQRLEEGKQAMDELEKWTKNAKDVFENKWLLLKAEYHSSVGELDQALQYYQDSIKAGQDHGNVHEMAMAFELLGDYCKGRGHPTNSKRCYTKAYQCYISWGAKAVASRLAQTHDIDITATGAGLLSSDGSKRQRD